MTAPELRRHRSFVRGVAEREQQTDRDRVRLADGWEGLDLERLELTVGPEATADAVAALERHEWLGMLGTQAIEMRARLAPKVQEMLEARIPDVREAGAAPLQE